MIPCRNCGRINEDAARICRYCGTSLAANAQATQQQEYRPPYAWAGTSPPPSSPASQMQQQQQPYAAPPAAAVGYRCPRCGAAYLPTVEKKISSDGWLIFILLLFFCVPLCWIGLLIKQEYRVCPVCHADLG
ncbi:MAG TPA: LITAF-like zinc ribbon domain-containing protein [Pyrinomonadaceae bacterium]|nr:LITAF-like zinc ribbon domain-containing protein [Pyrinomonadaceae bacterium]